MSQLSFTISAYLITYKHKHKLKPPPHLKGGGGEIEQLTQAQAPPPYRKKRGRNTLRGGRWEREKLAEKA